jgi:hypothetical protein
VSENFRGLGQRLTVASQCSWVDEFASLCVCPAFASAPYDGVTPRLYEQRAAVLVERHAGGSLRHAVHHPPRLRWERFGNGHPVRGG